MPEMIFTSVDLPAPLSPTSATTSPAMDLEVHAVECLDRSEPLADALQGEQRWLHGRHDWPIPADLQAAANAFVQICAGVQ